jgi:hypothetical protein
VIPTKEPSVRAAVTLLSLGTPAASTARTSASARSTPSDDATKPTAARAARAISSSSAAVSLANNSRSRATCSDALTAITTAMPSSRASVSLRASLMRDLYRAAGSDGKAPGACRSSCSGSSCCTGAIGAAPRIRAASTA